MSKTTLLKNGGNLTYKENSKALINLIDLFSDFFLVKIEFLIIIQCKTFEITFSSLHNILAISLLRITSSNLQ
jgi:hypothetical protein